MYLARKQFLAVRVKNYTSNFCEALKVVLRLFVVNALVIMKYQLIVARFRMRMLPLMIILLAMVITARADSLTKNEKYQLAQCENIYARLSAAELINLSGRLCPCVAPYPYRRRRHLT